MKKTLSSIFAAVVLVLLPAASLASAGDTKGAQTQAKPPVQTLQEGGPCAGC